MEKISFRKAFINDRFLFSAALITVIFLVVAIVLGYQSDFVFSVENFGFFIVGLWVVLSLVFLVLRLIQLSRFRADTKSYTAEVVNLFTYRGARRITFIYKIDGVEYKNGNFVMVNKYSKHIYKGDKVEINISETNPKKAFIREIYFDLNA